jgi:hypothetical protein
MGLLLIVFSTVWMISSDMVSKFVFFGKGLRMTPFLFSTVPFSQLW